MFTFKNKNINTSKNANTNTNKDSGVTAGVISSVTADVTAISKKFVASLAAFSLLPISLLSLLSLSACGSASSTKSSGTNASALNSNPQKGGSLTVFTSNTNMNFDPARSQGLPITSNNFIFRALTTWKVSPNSGDKTRVVPDLATDTGTTSDGGKTWKYTLKKGVKYEDGSEITSRDIKFGIERSFADSLSGGFSYHKTLLVGGENYDGPFSGKSLDSIETPDDQTIIFHLKAPFADWPWVASLAAFVPVPANSGDVQTYSKHPKASGPYRIVQNEVGKKVVMQRNKYWDSKLDSIRTAGPNEIVWKLGSDATVAAQSMIQGNSDTKSAFLADFVPPAQLAQAQANPKSRSLLTTSSDGALEYLAMNTRRITDINVRKAVQYAVDKQSYRTAKGGSIAGGFATTLITPGISGRKQFNLYATDPRGDVAKAKQLLKKSGQTGIKLSLIARPDQTQVASSVQSSLQRAGIKVTIKTVDAVNFTDAITSNSGDYDLALASWQPDFPSAYANLGPLFDSSQIGGGNWNISRYENPKVDALLRKAIQTVDSHEAEKLWQQADRTIMADSPVVPLIYSHNTFIHGSGVENFYIGSFPAYPNYAAISLKR